MPMTVARRVAACASLALVSLVAPSARADPSASQCAAAYADAQIARQRGRLRDARDAARTCASPACPAVGRKDCATWSAELDREVPSIVVVAQETTGAEVEPTHVFVDGAPRTDASGGRAIELDPGAHTLRVERAGDEPASIAITVFQGEHDRIVRVAVHPLAGASPAPASTTEAPPPGSVAPAPASPPSSSTEPTHPTYLPAAIVAGVSVAALGASAYLGLSGRSQLSDLRTSCAPTCTDDQVDPVRRRLLFSDLSLGLGVIAAGASLYLFLRPPMIGGATVDVGLGNVAVRIPF